MRKLFFIGVALFIASQYLCANFEVKTPIISVLEFDNSNYFEDSNKNKDCLA